MNYKTQKNQDWMWGEFRRHLYILLARLLSFCWTGHMMQWGQTR